VQWPDRQSAPKQLQWTWANHWQTRSTAQFDSKFQRRGRTRLSLHPSSISLCFESNLRDKLP